MFKDQLQRFSAGCDQVLTFGAHLHPIRHPDGTGALRRTTVDRHQAQIAMRKIAII